MRLLIDCSHTSHCLSHTGIQRVCRSLAAALQRRIGPERVRLITWDPYARQWRKLDRVERQRMAMPEDAPPAESRGTEWTFGQQFGGWLRRTVGRSRPQPVAENADKPLPQPFGAPFFTRREIEQFAKEPVALLVPEIFSPRVQDAYRLLFRQIDGPRAAIFYDAVPLRLPQYAAKGAASRFPVYLRELNHFDGLAAISEASAEEIKEFWEHHAIATPTPVKPIPLGVEWASIELPPLDVIGERPPAPENATPAASGSASGAKAAEADNARAAASPTGLPVILCVSTLEGRKNHAALLEAVENLWRKGLRFELILAGMARSEDSGSVVRCIRELKHKRGRPLLWDGAVSETELESYYRRCDFSVYPSIYEGFGLPVLESLRWGKPCICGLGGGLAEVTRGGGCLVADPPSAENLAAAIENLLGDRYLYQRLAREARARTFKSWDTYADELWSWLQHLRPRQSEGHDSSSGKK